MMSPCLKTGNRQKKLLAAPPFWTAHDVIETSEVRHDYLARRIGVAPESGNHEVAINTIHNYLNLIDLFIYY